MGWPTFKCNLIKCKLIKRLLKPTMPACLHGILWSNFQYWSMQPSYNCSHQSVITVHGTNLYKDVLEKVTLRISKVHDLSHRIHKSRFSPRYGQMADVLPNVFQTACFCSCRTANGRSFQTYYKRHASAYVKRQTIAHSKRITNGMLLLMSNGKRPLIPNVLQTACFRSCQTVNGRRLSVTRQRR